MTELSSANLYEPLLQGSGWLHRLDDLMWPTYRRVTLEQGGDHTAEFTISTDSHEVSAGDLERFFMNWIGCHFKETFGGQTVFEGFVDSMRINIGGITRQVNLEDMHNRVYARYRGGSASSNSVTAAANDTESQGIYGVKAIVYNTGLEAQRQKSLSVGDKELTTYIQQTHAEAIRDDFLDWRRLPQTTSLDVVMHVSPTVTLDVYMKGYSHTINWLYYDSSSTSTTTLSSHITTLLTGLDFVSEGDVETMSTTVSLEADYERRLDRLSKLIAGENMQWGCFGGRTFTAEARDLTSIKYRRQAYGNRYGFMQSGRVLPEPLITPGGWLYTQDIFSGFTPTPVDLKDDPRADWLHSVEYSIDGVTASNPSWDMESAIVAAAVALQTTHQERPQHHIMRARLG